MKKGYKEYYKFRDLKRINARLGKQSKNGELKPFGKTDQYLRLADIKKKRMWFIFYGEQNKLEKIWLIKNVKY